MWRHEKLYKGAAMNNQCYGDRKTRMRVYLSIGLVCIIELFVSRLQYAFIWNTSAGLKYVLL